LKLKQRLERNRKVLVVVNKLTKRSEFALKDKRIKSTKTYAFLGGISFSICNFPQLKNT